MVLGDQFVPPIVPRAAGFLLFTRGVGNRGSIGAIGATAMAPRGIWNNVFPEFGLYFSREVLRTCASIESFKIEVFPDRNRAD
jgi:hypothetical protein